MNPNADKRNASAVASSSKATPGQSTSRTNTKQTNRRRYSTQRQKYSDEESGYEDNSLDMEADEQMQLEKEYYPGAKSWAPDEERLFETLFRRQDLPMLPPNWDVDFSGVPISDMIFDTSEECPAIIFAHSREFQATTALMRLIDLTAMVRTSTQSGLRRKVPRLIKRELDKYLNWAAQDGGYHDLRIVPNIVTHIIDSSKSGDEITQFMQDRMRALAQLQREFLRKDRDAQFWEVVKPRLTHTPTIKIEREDSPSILRNWPELKEHQWDADAKPDELSTERIGLDGRVIKVETGTKRRLFHTPATPKKRKTDELDLYENTTPRSGKKARKSFPGENEVKTPDKTQLSQTSRQTNQGNRAATPKTPTKLTKYRRIPPVVYGFFILNTSVFLLTVDASQDDAAYVSFHVEADFHDKHQSVWNALTIAIAVCMARDELRGRRVDFAPLPVEVESDPDA